MTKTPQQIKIEVEKAGTGSSCIQPPISRLKEMKTIRILNLYAGIGGNRKLWTGDIEITAIENNPEIAKIYQDFFPNDKVIVCDAHEYLRLHYKEFDFIWSSRPCVSHSRIRRYSAVERGQNEAIYPDMALYEEIIFLENYFDGKYVVENVNSFYEPLIKPQEIDRHYFWANFIIGQVKRSCREHDAPIEKLSKRKGFDLSHYKTKIEKKLLLRNCVEPELGLHIFEMAFKKPQLTLLNLKESNSK
jgi:DNA (cytosine-5)-methyltransferase 1